MIKLNINSLDLEEMSSSITSEKFSSYSEISKLLGFNDIFITKEVLKPQRRLSSKHYHTMKEEVFIVLKGKPTLILNDEKSELTEGDIIGFKPSLKEFHTFVNLSKLDVEFLILANKAIKDEVIYDN